MGGGGWVGVLDEIKAISAQLGLGFGLSLAKWDYIGPYWIMQDYKGL